MLRFNLGIPSNLAPFDFELIELIKVISFAKRCCVVFNCYLNNPRFLQIILFALYFVKYREEETRSQLSMGCSRRYLLSVIPLPMRVDTFCGYSSLRFADRRCCKGRVLTITA